jgi:sugar (pentulose or hexulose) kinase
MLCASCKCAAGRPGVLLSRAQQPDPAGRLLASDASPYDTQYPHPGWAEQEPEDWWRALGQAVRGALAALGRPVRVAALCLDTTCCTVTALDGQGRALRPALLWMDMRSGEQARRVAAAEDEVQAARPGGMRGPQGCGCRGAGL